MPSQKCSEAWTWAGRPVASTVGADRSLAPVAAWRQMNVLAPLQSVAVADHVQDHPTRATIACGVNPQFDAMHVNGSASAACSRLAPWRALPERLSTNAARSGTICSIAVPPPGTMLSPTAALVALIASSINCTRRFCSTGVAPPARIVAEPPDNFASRSWYLSRSIFGGAASNCFAT